MNYCVVLEKIHTHPMEGHWKFPGGGGVLKAKFLEAMYENKLEFPGRGGCKTKTFLGGSMDIFWNCTFFTRVNIPLFFLSGEQTFMTLKWKQINKLTDG